MKTPVTGLVGSRYQLLDLLGEGGMARVFRALDTTTGTGVAVKQLREGLAHDPALVARFQHEATAAAALQHPNIVRVLGVGQDDGCPFLVLELVEGPDLRSRLLQDDPLPLPLVLTLGEQLCAALGAAHARGIIHRDVKPQNVLLSTATDGTVLARLTDFGIARALRATTQTRTGEVLGSVHYLSPEQLRGQPATARSDLYALGCLLYEVVTGRVPFEAESDIAVALRQLQETPLPPSHWRPGLPPGLDWIVLRCLDKDPTRRFASAAELADALRRYATFTERSTAEVEQPLPGAPIPPAGGAGLATAFTRTAHGRGGTAASRRFFLPLALGLVVPLLAGLVVAAATLLGLSSNSSPAAGEVRPAVMTPVATSTPVPTESTPELVTPPRATMAPPPASKPPPAGIQPRNQGNAQPVRPGEPENRKGRGRDGERGHGGRGRD